MQGVYNGVAPEPVTNKELVIELASETRRKAYIPIYVPQFGLKLVLGEMSIEVLKSTTVSSSKIEATGFQFIYPSVKSAIAELVN